MHTLNSLLGANGAIVVMAMITTGIDEKAIYFEDETMKVKVDLSEAEGEGDTYFTEGNVVLALGTYNNVVMKV